MPRNNFFPGLFLSQDFLDHKNMDTITVYSRTGNSVSSWTFKAGINTWGKTRYVTVNDHMPPGKLFFVDWDGERFLKWAEKIGRSCKKVIQQVLDKAVIEQQAYRSCFGILGLKDKYSGKRLENACSYLLEAGSSPTYSQIKRILERDEDLVSKDEENHHTAKPKGFSRGADYFGQD